MSRARNAGHAPVSRDVAGRERGRVRAGEVHDHPGDVEVLRLVSPNFSL